MTQFDFCAEMDHSAAQALDDRIRRRDYEVELNVYCTVIAGEQPTRTSAYISATKRDPRIALVSLYAGEADEPFADLARERL